MTGRSVYRRRIVDRYAARLRSVLRSRLCVFVALIIGMTSGIVLVDATLPPGLKKMVASSHGYRHAHAHHAVMSGSNLPLLHTPQAGVPELCARSIERKDCGGKLQRLLYYAVFTQTRSGSTWMDTTLRSHPCVHSLGEKKRALLVRWSMGKVHADDDSMNRMVHDDIWGVNASWGDSTLSCECDTVALGHKVLMPNSFRPSLSLRASVGFLRTLWHNCFRIIFLQRWNQLDRFISRHSVGAIPRSCATSDGSLCTAGGKHVSFPLPAMDAVSFVSESVKVQQDARALLQQVSTSQSWLAGKGFSPPLPSQGKLVVRSFVYEKLSALSDSDRATMWRDLARFVLGDPDDDSDVQRGRIEEIIEKRIDVPQSEIVENYGEVCQVLSRAGHGEFCTALAGTMAASMKNRNAARATRITKHAPPSRPSSASASSSSSAHTGGFRSDAREHQHRASRLAGDEARRAEREPKSRRARAPDVTT